MAIRLSVLSGPQKGQSADFVQSKIVVSDRAGADFRLKSNGATSELHLSKSKTGWQIESLGSAQPILNHQAIKHPVPFRSGDVVRLSAEGPALALRVIADAEATRDNVPPAETSNQPASTANVETTTQKKNSASLNFQQLLIAFLVMTLAALTLILATRRPPGAIVAPAAQNNEQQNESSETPIVPNTPPEIEAPQQTVLAGERWQHELLAVDAETPRHELRFHSDQLPTGLTLTTEGKLSWQPGQEQTGQHKIKLSVTDTGEPSKTSSTILQITVPPFEAAPKSNLRSGVLLLTVTEPKSKTVFPFGTATKISKTRLITTAMVARELAKYQNQGFAIAAIGQETRLPATDFYVSKWFAQSESRRENIFVDIGIVKVAEESSIPIHEVEVTNLSVGELTGLPHDGKNVAPEKITEQATVVGKHEFAGSIPLELWEIRLGKPYPSLFLHGSPLFNDDNQIVGIYVERSNADTHFVAPCGAWLQFSPTSQSLDTNHWRRPKLER